MAVSDYLSNSPPFQIADMGKFIFYGHRGGPILFWFCPLKIVHLQKHLWIQMSSFGKAQVDLSKYLTTKYLLLWAWSTIFYSLMWQPLKCNYLQPWEYQSTGPRIIIKMHIMLGLSLIDFLFDVFNYWRKLMLHYVSGRWLHSISHGMNNTMSAECDWLTGNFTC